MVLPENVRTMAAQWQVKAMSSEGQIHRPTDSRTASGAFTKAWAPVTGIISLRVAPGPSGENQYQRALVEKLGAVTSWWITLPVDTDIRLTDRIYQTFPSSEAYEVVAIPNESITLGTARRVLGIQVS